MPVTDGVNRHQTGHVAFAHSKPVEGEGDPRIPSEAEAARDRIALTHFVNPLDGCDGSEFSPTTSTSVGNEYQPPIIDATNTAAIRTWHSGHSGHSGQSRASLTSPASPTSPTSPTSPYSPTSPTSSISPASPGIREAPLATSPRGVQNNTNVPKQRFVADGGQEWRKAFSRRIKRRGILQGGLLGAVTDPTVYAIAITMLVIFSVALMLFGALLINAEGKDNDFGSFSDLGAYLGIPLLLFGVLFSGGSIASARQFYGYGSQSYHADEFELMRNFA